MSAPAGNGKVGFSDLGEFVAALSVLAAVVASVPWGQMLWHPAPAVVVCSLLAAALFFRCVHFLGPTEQLCVVRFTERQMIRGPGISLLSPFVKSASKHEAVTLGPQEACKLQDELTGEVRVEKGPQLLFLGAYEKSLWKGEATILGTVGYLTVLDQQTGERRLVRGPCTFVAGPYEEIVEKREAIALKNDQYILLEDKASGKRWVEVGEMALYLEPNWQAVGKVTHVTSLKNVGYLTVEDKQTGKRRLVMGPCTFVPGPYEEVLEAREAIALKNDQYVVLEDQANGKRWVEVGEKLVYLEPTWQSVGKVTSVISLKNVGYLTVEDKETGERRLVKGPCTFVPGPYEEVVEAREAIALKNDQYILLEDKATGKRWVEVGEKLVYLEPTWQAVGKVTAVISLTTVGYLTVEDKETGEQRLVKGPSTFVPGPYEEVVEAREAIALQHDQYILLEDKATGKRWVEVGEKLIYLEPTWQTVGDVTAAISLKTNEFVRFLDQASGKIRVERGEQGRVVPGPHEVLLDLQGKRQAVDLKVFEYVRIEDKETGRQRVERGEQLVFLGPTEEVVPAGKQKAVEVDETAAVLVRNKRTGQQSLKTERQLFIPAPDEEILEVRRLIKLAEHEAVVVRDKDGVDSFYFGKNETRSFFLPPHAELVEHLWSRGRRRERRDLRFHKVDCRPQFMSFEFNCRTSDNVELVLEGTFFWQVVDVKAMVRNTADTTLDICSHARACFIQLVSRVKLAEFMADFESIAQRVYQQDDRFYADRGVKIHSLEVTRYACADQSTAAILEQIIQETTNRMNRLQKQESESEVHLFRIKGDIEEERATGELLEVRQQNVSKQASMEGAAEAERVRAFLEDLEGSVPKLEKRVEIWNVLRKGDALGALSKGSARLYFTPNDCSLSIESHEHEHRVTAKESERSESPDAGFACVEAEG